MMSLLHARMYFQSDLVCTGIPQTYAFILGMDGILIPGKGLKVVMEDTSCSTCHIAMNVCTRLHAGHTSK